MRSISLSAGKWFAAFLVVMVMLSGVGPFIGIGAEFVGTASATHRCGYDDVAVTAFASVAGGLTGGAISYSQFDCDLFHSGEEPISDADADQEKLDIYLAATSQEQSSKQFRQVHANYINDSKPIAWGIVQNVTHHAYTNGRSEAVATTKARNAVEEYYAQRQLSVYRRWNQTASKIAYWEEVIDNESDIGESYLKFYDSDPEGGETTNELTDLEKPYLETVTRTLVNGTEVDVLALNVTGGDTTAGGGIEYVAPDADHDPEDGADSDDDLTTKYLDLAYLSVDAPSSDFDELKFEIDQWEKAVERPDNASADLFPQIDTFVNSSYQSFENGTADPQDLIDYKTMVAEMATANTSGQAGALLNALSLGLTPSNLTETGEITVTFDGGGNKSGILVTGNRSRETFKQGQVIANGSGDRFWLATEEGLVPINDPATITNITNRSGTEIQEVGTSKTTRVVTNASEIRELVDRVSEAREEAEERKQAVGGGILPKGPLFRANMYGLGLNETQAAGATVGGVGVGLFLARDTIAGLLGGAA